VGAFMSKGAGTKAVSDSTERKVLIDGDEAARSQGRTVDRVPEPQTRSTDSSPRALPPAHQQPTHAAAVAAALRLDNVAEASRHAEQHAAAERAAAPVPLRGAAQRGARVGGANLSFLAPVA
jgi:hypothetical protein